MKVDQLHLGQKNLQISSNLIASANNTSSSLREGINLNLQLVNLTSGRCARRFDPSVFSATNELAVGRAIFVSVSHPSGKDKQSAKVKFVNHTSFVHRVFKVGRLIWQRLKIEDAAAVMANAANIVEVSSSLLYAILINNIINFLYLFSGNRPATANPFRAAPTTTNWTKTQNESQLGSSNTENVQQDFRIWSISRRFVVSRVRLRHHNKYLTEKSDQNSLAPRIFARSFAQREGRKISNVVWLLRRRRH